MNSSRISSPSKPPPQGAKFFEAISNAEARCSAATLVEIQNLGISTPASFESLGNVLSLLYAEASCSNGCAGGDHLWQRFTARIVSCSLASLRLALSGYYDESLALTRSVGEIANLLFLFAAKPDLVKSWQSGDDKYRKGHFSPVKIRLALEKLGLRPPVDESRYSLLCEIGVHVTPSVSPQAFNEHSRPTLGAVFKDGELMATLNELALVVAESAGCVSTLPFVGARALSLRAAAQVLLNMVGNYDLSAASDERANGV